MRILARILLPVLVAAMALSACRTSQENMNRAYRQAVQARNQEHEDSTIYSAYRRQMQHSAMVMGDDTVDVSIQFVKVTDDGGGIPESLKRYCVVAGQFKMVFNAKSMRERLAGAGYPGAFVVETREPYYFVVAAAYTDAPQALEALEQLRQNAPVGLKDPCPFILEPSQLRR